MSLTVGSLFSGIGGFDLGFERAGFEVKWQVEIDPFCRKVLEKHWPNVRRYEDVRTVGDELEPVDIVVGGDPCQRNSNAWRHGTGDDSLGGEFVRVVDALRPRFVVRENPSVVRRDAPWDWRRFRGALEGLGYAVLPVRLRSCCFGQDHRRERLFLLAELQNANGARLERDERAELARTDKGRQDADATGPAWRNPTPRICGSVDRIPDRVDRLRSIGNSVSPQIAQWIAERIKDAEG
jgi:DNA (cytosine-5)-methyltransferase 1